MISIDVINNRISTIDATLDSLNLRDKEQKRAAKKLAKEREYLVNIRSYIESEPREEFLRNEVVKIQRRLKLIADAYKDWVRPATVDHTKAIDYYNKENGVPDLKRHLKNTLFILNTEKL